MPNGISAEAKLLPVQCYAALRGRRGTANSRCRGRRADEDACSLRLRNAFQLGEQSRLSGSGFAADEGDSSAATACGVGPACAQRFYSASRPTNGSIVRRPRCPDDELRCCERRLAIPERYAGSLFAGQRSFPASARPAVRFPMCRTKSPRIPPQALRAAVAGGIARFHRAPQCVPRAKDRSVIADVRSAALGRHRHRGATIRSAWSDFRFRCVATARDRARSTRRSNRTANRPRTEHPPRPALPRRSIA